MESYQALGLWQIYSESFLTLLRLALRETPYALRCLFKLTRMEEMSLQARVRGKSYPGLISRLLKFALTMGIGMVLGILVLTYFIADSIYDYQDTVSFAERQLPQVDAIVVLAGGRGRIRAAGDTWEKYFDQIVGSQPSLAPSSKRKSAQKSKLESLPFIYVSGMGPQADYPVFSSQLRTSLKNKMKKREVDLEKYVYLENQSVNTLQNAKLLSQYATQKGWTRILLVTSSYHMKRSKLIFNHVFRKSGSPIKMLTMSYEVKPFVKRHWRSEWDAIRVTMLEYLKWVYYRYLY